MVSHKQISPAVAVRNRAIPLLTVRTYLMQRRSTGPVTVAGIMTATGISEYIIRDVVQALLRSGFPCEVYDGVMIVPQAFECEAA